MINSATPTVIDSSLVIGKFVSKRNAFIISTIICLLLIMIMKFSSSKYCQSFKRKDIKEQCNKMIKNKILYILIVFTGYYYFVPFIHTIQDTIVNRQAYLTLNWFDKYLKQMSRHNLNGLNLKPVPV